MTQAPSTKRSAAPYTVFQSRSARPHRNEISTQASNPLSTFSSKLQSEESIKESSMRSSREMAFISPHKKDIIELDKEIIDLDPEVIPDKDEIPYPGDVMTEEEFERWIAHQQQLQQQPKTFRKSRTRTSYIRNGPIVPPFITLDTYQHGGLLLRPRVNVELQDGDFLRICCIIQNVSTDEVLLRGRLFRRLTFMNGTLEKKTNEVCWIIHIDQDDTRPSEVQCLEEVKVDEAIKRRGLKLTNRNFPCLSWRDESNKFTETNDTVRNDRVLVCRWKYICSYANAAARKNNVHTQKALMRLREHESDRGCGIDDKLLRRQWRGESVLGGASSLISYEEIERQRHEKVAAQQAVARRSTFYNTPQVTKKRSLPASADCGLRSKPIDLTIEGDLQAGFHFIDLDAGEPEWISSTSTSEKYRIASLSSSSDVNSTINIEPREFGELSAPPSPTMSVSTVGKNEHRTIIDLTDGSEPESDGLSAIGDLESEKGRFERHEKDTHVQRYTFADTFCGCGGISRGASMAELHLKWAFDFASAMCRSYQRNFPAARVYCTSADQFVMQKIMDVVVDILHMSPPCNYFSPAHTTEGRDDDENTAASFVITELLKMILPRVVTLENTLGLERRHPLYLHAVLQQFTVLGFSVAWKIIKLADYGIPQNRERLVIIAAWYVELESSLTLTGILLALAYMIIQSRRTTARLPSTYSLACP